MKKYNYTGIHIEFEINGDKHHLISDELFHSELLKSFQEGDDFGQERTANKLKIAVDALDKLKNSGVTALSNIAYEALERLGATFEEQTPYNVNNFQQILNNNFGGKND